MGEGDDGATVVVVTIVIALITGTLFGVAGVALRFVGRLLFNRAR